MSTVSGVTPSNIYGYGVTSPTTSTGANPVAQTSDSELSQEATTLSEEADVIATLGSTSLSSPTYNAVDLLNSLVQAGSAPSSAQSAATPDSGTTTQNSADQTAVGTSPSDATAAGVYNASGSLQSFPLDTQTNWVNALQANPNLASLVTADSQDQAIVGNLSIYA